MQNAAQLRNGPRQSAMHADRPKRAVLTHGPKAQGLLRAVEVTRGLGGGKRGARFAVKRDEGGSAGVHVVAVEAC